MTAERKIFESGLIRESYILRTLPSGLRICFFPRKSVTVGAAMVVNAGAFDTCFRMAGEAEARKLPAGCAHYLEHVMFALPDGGDALEAFAGYGASANAYTASETTTYYFSCTDNGEPFLESLSLLLSLMARPAFTEKTIEKERPIIAEEISMCRDEPGDVLWETAMKALYREHPAREPVCGTKASLAEIGLSVLNRFLTAFYQPENMILVVEGDIGEEQTIALCREYFPDDCKKTAVERVLPREEPTPAARFSRTETDTALPLAAVCFKDTEISTDPMERMKKCETVSLLSDLLFSGTSHFYNELYDDGIIDGRFSVEYEHSRAVSYFIVNAETPEPEEFVRRVKSYIAERQKLHDISEEAFQRCRRVMYASSVYGFESPGGSMPTDCANIAFDGGELFRQIDIMMQIRREDLFALLDTYFSEENCAVSVVYPIDRQEQKG